MLGGDRGADLTCCFYKVSRTPGTLDDSFTRYWIYDLIQPKFLFFFFLKRLIHCLNLSCIPRKIVGLFYDVFCNFVKFDSKDVQIL